MNKKTTISQFSENIPTNILSYTNIQSMECIIKVLPYKNTGNQLSEHMIKLIRFVYFLKKYINSFDRTMYCHLPDNYYTRINQKYYLEFKDENTYIEILSMTKKFQQLQHQLTNTFSPGLCVQLMKTFLNPCLPLPKLTEQNLQSLCKTTFQFMLLDKYQQQHNPTKFFYKKISHNTTNSNNAITILTNTIQQKRQKYVIEMSEFQIKSKSEIFSLVYLRPQEVGVQNYLNVMVEGCQIHNFVVMVLGYIDQLIGSWEVYFNLIRDPVQLFAQFNTRFSLLINITQELQQALSPIFKQYGEIVSQVIQSNSSESYSIYKPTFKKWHKKMNKFYEKCEQVYRYLFLKERNNRVIQKFEQFSKLPSQSFLVKKYISKMLEQTKYDAQIDQLKTKIYTDIVPQAQFQMQSNSFHRSFNLLNFEESMMDTPLDIKTVNWSNHSKFQSSQSYKNLSQNILTHYCKYYMKLKQQTWECTRQQKSHILKQLLRIDSGLFYEYFHSTTLSKFLNLVPEIEQGSIDYIQDITTAIKRKDYLIQYMNKKRQVPTQAIQIKQSSPNSMQLNNVYINFDGFEQYNSDDESEFDSSINSKLQF